jgi:hypothetical protein
VDTSLPVPEDVAMTLTAEKIALCEIDEITICKP